MNGAGWRAGADCRRVCGWRAKHAVSLGHGSLVLLAWVRAGAEVTASPRLAFTLNVIMAKSISVKHKKRGRPATGTDPLMGFRASPEMRASVVRWAENQPDTPSLSESIRRLVEIGLSKSEGKKPRVLSTSKQGASRAAELAAKTIDRRIDAGASAEDREVRKRKLVEGPSAFRSTRRDRPGK